MTNKGVDYDKLFVYLCRHENNFPSRTRIGCFRFTEG